MFNPLCKWCGARLIKMLGTLDRPREEIKGRRLSVLYDWQKYGCSREEVRALVKESFPVEPLQKSRVGRKKAGD